MDLRMAAVWRKANIGHQQRTFGAPPSYALLHGRALHIGPDGERAGVELSQVGDGRIEIEQADMTNDELSNTCLLRDAAHDGRCRM